jgi:hypothetical protein
MDKVFSETGRSLTTIKVIPGSITAILLMALTGPLINETAPLRTTTTETRGSKMETLHTARMAGRVSELAHSRIAIEV